MEPSSSALMLPQQSTEEQQRVISAPSHHLHQNDNNSNLEDDSFTVIPYFLRMSGSTFHEFWECLFKPFLTGVAFGIGTHLSRGFYIQICSLLGIKGSLTLPQSTPTSPHTEQRIIKGNQVHVIPAEPVTTSEMVKDAAATAVGAAITH